MSNAEVVQEAPASSGAFLFREHQTVITKHNVHDASQAPALVDQVAKRRLQTPEITKPARS
jgi:hypothetical protein